MGFCVLNSSGTGGSGRSQKPSGDQSRGDQSRGGSRRRRSGGPKGKSGVRRPAKRSPAANDDAFGAGVGGGPEPAAASSAAPESEVRAAKTRRPPEFNDAERALPTNRPKADAGTGVTFDSMNLPSVVARAVAGAGYQSATEIQAAAIPPAMEGRDVLGIAQTGTGKTAAFALPILARIAKNPGKSVPKRPRVLVLSPTRELAAQILASFADYGRHLKLRNACIFGGVGQHRQVKALERGVHVLIATPGRLIDLMDQGFVDLGGLDTFVLDEADRMLDMGFLPAIRKIIRQLPRQRQSLFFSATMPGEVQGLVDELLTDPVRIDVTPEERSVDLIEQSVQFVLKKDKPQRLVEVLSQPDVGQAVVFTRTKRGANVVAERLVKEGIRSEAIHGNKSQNARTRTLDGFRDGRVQVLVATDLAARGLDIDDVTHVINYELPNEPESYVHRIGRTGRAGAQGVAIAFCGSEEKAYLRDIERLIGRPVPRDGEDNIPELPPEPMGGGRGRGRGRGGRPGGGGSSRHGGGSRGGQSRGSGHPRSSGRPGGGSGGGGKSRGRRPGGGSR